MNDHTIRALEAQHERESAAFETLAERLRSQGDHPLPVPSAFLTDLDEACLGVAIPTHPAALAAWSTRV